MAWSGETADEVLELVEHDEYYVDLVASLIDKNLLRLASGSSIPRRLEMLGTIRDFALQQLRTAGELPQMRARHAQWFLSFVEQAASHYHRREEPVWMERLMAEATNIRQALNHVFTAGGTLAALRLAGALGWHWDSTGQVEEGRQWLDQALAGPLPDDEPAVASALAGSGLLHYASGDLIRAAERLREARQRYGRLGDEQGTVRTLIWTELVAIGQDDPEGAVAVCREALALAQGGDDPVWTGLAIVSLAHALILARRPGAAPALLAEARRLLAEAGYERGEGWACEVLGSHALLAGDYEAAAREFRAGFALAWKHGGPTDIAHSFPRLAAVAAARGDVARAARLLGATAAARQAIGATPDLDRNPQTRETARLARTALGDERYAQEVAAAHALPLAASVAQVLGRLDVATREALEAEPARHAPIAGLSRRETDVLRLLVDGCSDREIADALVISRYTASTHVHNVLAKLGVPTRTAAVAYALRHGVS